MLCSSGCASVRHPGLTHGQWLDRLSHTSTPPCRHGLSGYCPYCAETAKPERTGRGIRGTSGGPAPSEGPRSAAEGRQGSCHALRSAPGYHRLFWAD